MLQIIFIVISIFLVIILYKVLTFLIGLKRKIKSKGFISAIIKKEESTRIRYHYIINFKLKDSDKTFSGEKINNTPYLYNLNENITIYYDKKDPNIFLAKSFYKDWQEFYIWLLSLFFVGFGLYQTYLLMTDIEDNIPLLVDRLRVVLFILLFLLFFYLSISNFKKTFLFLKKSIKTCGIIKGFEKIKDSDNFTRYKSVVEYIDYQNKKYSFVSKRMLTDQSSKGKKINIVYDKDFPNIAEEDSFFGLWGICFFYFSFSIVFFIIIIFLLS